MERKCNKCESKNYYAKGMCHVCYEANTRKKGKCISCGKQTCRAKYKHCNQCALRLSPRHVTPHTQESREKMRRNNWRAKNENHPQWKGDDVTYSALHLWVRRNKGVPRACESCNKECKLQASNKDHKYSRNLDDWQFLCPKCHKQYDIEHILVDTKGEKHHQWGKKRNVGVRKKISDSLKKRNISPQLYKNKTSLICYEKRY